MENIFGQRLRELRQKKGLTQRELAKRLGISPSAVGMYEQGRREPENSLLSELCRILDTTTDYLIGFTKTPQDVGDVIEDFTGMLMSQQGLMFNGQPITAEDREKIVIAIKSAAAVVIPDNGKKNK